MTLFGNRDGKGGGGLLIYGQRRFANKTSVKYALVRQLWPNAKLCCHLAPNDWPLLLMQLLK